MSNLSLNAIPLEWVRAFETAGRLGSFTAAAQELGVTQSAISQRVTNLEARIDRALFVRGQRGITLSVDGETWLPHVYNAMLDLEHSYEDIFGRQRQKLTISASASIIELWLTPRLRNWDRHTRPQIVFSTRVLASDTRGRDAALRIDYGTGDWPDHHCMPLFTEQLCPVAAPSLLAGQPDWRSLPRIAVSGPRAGWHDWSRLTGAPAAPAPGLRFDSFVAAQSAAIAGEGVVLASLPLCQTALERGQLIQLDDPLPSSQKTYWMRGHKDSMTSSFWRRAAAHFSGP